MGEVYGLTGVMGSGKTTVAREFAELGAEIVDTDAIVRKMQKRGKPGYDAMVSILGEQIVGDSGELNRKKTAELMFGDESKKRKIESALYPMVDAEVDDQLSCVGLERIAIIDSPIWTPELAVKVMGLIVVNTTVETSVGRLRQRGFSEREVRERLSQQISNSERLKMADFVVDNNGDLESLKSNVLSVWRKIGGFCLSE